MADYNKISAIAVTFAFLAFILQPALCGAAPREVVVVQSSEIKPFSEVIDGFEETCGCSIREIITLSHDDLDLISRIRNLRPDGVLAVGAESLLKLQAFKTAPVFYTMVASPPPELRKSSNVSGVSMLVSPERFAEDVLQILPALKRVAFIYNPANTGQFVERITKYFRSHGVSVTAKQAEAPSQVPKLLEEIKGKADAFLLLPDATVAASESVNILLISSFRYSIPVIAFSEKYVRMGALAAITISPRDLGMQIGEIAKSKMSGAHAQKTAHVYPRRHVLIINMKIAKKMNIELKEAVLRKSVKVE